MFNDLTADINNCYQLTLYYKGTYLHPTTPYSRIHQLQLQIEGNQQSTLWYYMQHLLLLVVTLIISNNFITMTTSPLTQHIHCSSNYCVSWLTTKCNSNLFTHFPGHHLAFRQQNFAVYSGIRGRDILGLLIG